MADKKKSVRTKKVTKKEELSSMIDGAKEEITNAAKNLVVEEVKDIKKEITKAVVDEVKNILKDTKNELDEKVSNVNKSVDKLEKSIKETESTKEIELVEQEDNPVIDEEFIPIENEVICSNHIEVETDDCIGRLISRENYPITIKYDGGKIVISPRERKKGIVRNLIEEKIPKGITFIKDF
jgi:vacuolar-type H+-ATPase subunit E/Vma4